jgi:hypothetical protein
MTDHRASGEAADGERLRRLLVSSTSLVEEALTLARALGPEVSGTIVAQVIDAPFKPSTSGCGIRAAQLAGELGIVAAVDPLVRYIDRTGVRFPVGKTILSVLARLGTAGVGAMLRIFERCDGEERPRVTQALARSSVADERIRAHLVRMLAEAPAFAAPLLAQRGEWRAVPELLRAFDTVSQRPEAQRSVHHADDLSAIGSAVLALGGTLTREHEARIDDAFMQSEPMDDDWLDELA